MHRVCYHIIVNTEVGPALRLRDPADFAFFPLHYLVLPKSTKLDVVRFLKYAACTKSNLKLNFSAAFFISSEPFI